MTRSSPRSSATKARNAERRGTRCTEFLFSCVYSKDAGEGREDAVGVVLKCREGERVGTVLFLEMQFYFQHSSPGPGEERFVIRKKEAALDRNLKLILIIIVFVHNFGSKELGYLKL